MSEGEIGRRKVLTVLSAAGAAASLGAVPGCSGDDGTGTDAGATGDTGATPTDGGTMTDSGMNAPAGFDAGAVSDYTAPAWKIFRAPTQRAVVGRDAMGFFALSTVCPHENCDVHFTAGVMTMESADGALRCPCHSSRFTGDGSYVNGPANGPLRGVAVSIVEGRVRVNTTMTVARTVRVSA